MPENNKSTAKRMAAPVQRKPVNKTAATQKKYKLKTKLEDCADKQVILTTLGIKDTSLKNMRRHNIVPYSKIIGKYYYHKPSFVKLLEANVKGKL